jgi:PAS domain-containing protein
MDGDGRRLEQFEALVHASPDFIAIGSVDGKVEFLNPAGRRLIGVGLDVDLTTSTIEDYLNPERYNSVSKSNSPRWRGTGCGPAKRHFVIGGMAATFRSWPHPS